MARNVDILETPIEYLKGVGPARADVLKKELGIFNFNHLLTYYPFRYIDRSKFYKIREINDDSTYIQIKGTILNIQKIGKPRSQRLVAMFRDESGITELVWFKGIKWIEQKLTPGAEYVVFGKPNLFNNRYNFPHPEIETVAEQQETIEEKLQPFYS